MRTLTYASRDGVDLRLDLYLPAQPIRRPTPVIVFLHGGGWSGGTRTTGPDFSRYFARDGFAMASIEYRLTPSITFPANVEDVRTAVRWLKANAAAHALDPDRICLWGTSAGGHLAAVAGLAPRGDVRGHRQSELLERRPLRAGCLRADPLRRDGRPDRGGTGEAAACRRHHQRRPRRHAAPRPPAGAPAGAETGAEEPSPADEERYRTTTRLTRVAAAGRACSDRSGPRARRQPDDLRREGRAAVPHHARPRGQLGAAWSERHAVRTP